MVQMVQENSGRRELEPTHHVARHCRRRDIRGDGRVSPAAFALRAGEEYLSTNWLEHFHDTDRPSQIAGVSIATCQDNLNLEIQFVALGEAHDPSHTGIYGYTAHNAAVATLLATLVNPDEVYPADD